MRARLLPLLIVLMAGVLLALGFPLAASMAATEQQRVVVDRIDDTARFASLAQFVAARPAPLSRAAAEARVAEEEQDERLSTLTEELDRYHELYGIRAGVFFRDGRAMAASPDGWRVPRTGEGAAAFAEALAGRRSHDPPQVWPWQRSRIAVASPVIRDGDVVAVVLTDSPTGPLRSRILRDWLPLVAGEAAAMLLALGAATRLAGWVLRPVRDLDKAAHGIATGRLASRVAAAGGPPELQRLARSFNEMADHVEDVLEQQRAFVADASHQLRNPLSALLLRIELLGLELPPGHADVASVQAEGKRLARVLDGLLGLATAEHSPADLRLTDVGALAAERVAAWRPVAERGGVVLRTAGAAAVTGWADPVALSSALDAVVDNAVKFTPEGGEVTVTVAAAGDHVTVEVLDGGPGLTEEELERVGDRFWRSGRHQNVSGSGLGLSIARALLAAGEATIAYACGEERGLRVTITLPRTAR
ncbi:HAMP domain-containing sensor histidine kinase [Streptomyces sp. TRM 70351]|uniref:sensor histidine kinase n=1 Tax=Streptomyces sp. TRM 70351 TaxID=3116552 RepID=UPI002E7C3470|nr:HAMP domain-containing sensor histidine kinase [Streptomyces sp. TRM 70351]MEE1926593.1 HAMP domain-containing sensor histidine kinase [Streptomyces sp. TRM 70351]